MKFSVSKTLKIAASSWGSQSDPLVILLHGGGQTRHAWGATGKKLSEAGFYALAIDLRGHGDSDWDEEGDYSINAYKHDLVTIIKKLGRSASLVGASLGGMISLSLAGDKDNSGLCSSLVMVDIGIYPNPEGSDRILNFMQSRNEGFESLEDAAKTISNYLPHRKKPKDTKGLIKNLRLKEDGKYYWHWDPRFIQKREQNKRKNFYVSLEQSAKRVTVPTLLIRGALSDVVTQKEVKLFLSTIAHAEFEEIQKAAHMIAGDKNDIFAEATIKFLKSL